MRGSKKHIILISLFLIILITPTIVQILGVENKDIDNENRAKAEFPHFEINKPIQFLKDFKSYYKDNFGLRNTFSNNYLAYKNNILKESPLPAKVVKGKNDFLFLGNSFSNVVNESLGFSLFSKRELNTIKNNILEREKWLNEHNIKFYIAIAPNKHTIYRENLPFTLPKMETRKEQFFKYIKSEINFDIIDLGAQFYIKKRENRLYRKHNSHWNDLGAFYATQTLIETIKKDFQIESLKLSDYKMDSLKSYAEISKLININRKETRIVLTPVFKDASKEVFSPKYYSQEFIYESRYKNPSKKLKVLLFRDSFSSALKPFINHSFGETTFIWSHRFDKELILKEKPDLVIMEYVERYIERL